MSRNIVSFCILIKMGAPPFQPPSGNCQECDFQASSQIILNKHHNLSHKKKEEIGEHTFKCQQCNTQFSAHWNLQNHKRDEHDRDEDCLFFKKEKCRFPDNICWKKHVTKENNSNSSTTGKCVECHECSEKFKRFSEMMMHKKKEHPNKVKVCRDPLNCDFRNCWYLHTDKDDCDVEVTKEVTNSDKTNQNFQLGQVKPKPPLQKRNVLKTPN